MTNTSANSKRIAKNTLLLYVRMLFMMAVSLYTSRVVLNALGVEDFGIYNVVGGVVAMFSMLSGSLYYLRIRNRQQGKSEKDILLIRDHSDRFGCADYRACRSGRRMVLER